MKKKLSILIAVVLTGNAHAFNAIPQSKNECSPTETYDYIKEVTASLFEPTTIQTWEDTKTKLEIASQSAKTKGSFEKTGNAVIDAKNEAIMEKQSELKSSSGGSDEAECDITFGEFQPVDIDSLIPDIPSPTEMGGFLEEMIKKAMEKAMEEMNDMCARIEPDALVQDAIAATEKSIGKRYDVDNVFSGGDISNQVVNNILDDEVGSSKGKLLNVMDDELDDNRKKYIERQQKKGVKGITDNFEDSLDEKIDGIFD